MVMVIEVMNFPVPKATVKSSNPVVQWTQKRQYGRRGTGSKIL